MAEYAARVVELHKDVAQLREQALAQEKSGGPPAVLATYVRLDADIASYGEWRDGGLKSCLDIIKPDSSATEKTRQEAWVNAHSKSGTNAFRTLTDLTSRDEDSIKRPFEIVAMQESMAFAAIAKMPMAGFVGRLREHIREFEKQEGYLNDRWRELTGADERYDGEIAYLRVELLKVFKDSVEDARGWGPKIEEAVRKGVAVWKTSDDLSPDPPISEPVVIITKTLAMLQRTLDDVTQQTQRIYDSERTIFTLFGNARQQVMDYLEDVNPKAIANKHAEACRGTREAANGCPTEGQKTDVKALAEKIISASDESVRDFNAAFKRFYDAFNGKFTGEVSQETTELLSEQTFFNEYWKEVESLGLPAKFQQASEDLTRCESLTFDQLTLEQQKKLKEVIQSRLAEIKAQIRSYDTSFVERVKLLYVGPAREAMRDFLKRLPGFKE